jgi:hypothetical protein
MMRVNVTIVAHGHNLKSITESLLEEWRELVSNDEAPLPTDSELQIQRDMDAELYTATYTARIKIDTGEGA